MQEEANLTILAHLFQPFTEHRRQEHEMVIMHPDKVPVLCYLANSFRECLVGLIICFPVLLVEINFARMVMKQRPKDRVAETVVMHISYFVLQENGHTRMLILKLLMNLIRA
jgi:hypothetical protein